MGSGRRFLLFGGSGWIGGKVTEYLKGRGEEVVVADRSVRLQDLPSVVAEVNRVQPTHIINAAGVTGRPNVDWCEDHREETFLGNVVGPLNLAYAATECASKPHYTIFGTGCIYEYDTKHPMYSGFGFKEDEPANFKGSFYSRTKAVLEEGLRQYPNCLILRVRMPLTDELAERNFITKIARYEKVVDIPNSMTVLEELIPVGITLAEHGLTGVYNYTNPGVISHNEILNMYKKYIDPSYSYKNFSVEEQTLILKAGRSNNELDTTKMEKACLAIGLPPINHIRVAVEELFKRMKDKPSTAGIVKGIKELRAARAAANGIKA
mmetsp:Transcript_45878/g.74865  ORF Transcript_45878/g.74865 Transcript_45878/m.74865 type:complete len:322 (-) Transcript_45878:182-1147(-)|eukprot:CAMPEP_0184655842 /NCGR_PEP_ID=MMETSP0308-20130426/14601_1 /TAXON_ID=38269 /ORGANISM="Gloeochaete witrockiana, Strain SAG 46.84" /LENGTH=321 /DNA_ID=CAMNT_0027092619 /DNA_START=135 /DNA_END=1100 /DNA_ORIENTATION=+